MTDDLTLRDLDRSIQKLALAVEAIITKLELIGAHQGEKNDAFNGRITEAEKVLWRDADALINRMREVEKTLRTIQAAQATEKARKDGITDSVTGAVLIKGVLFILGLAGAGAGYALIQMVAKGG